MKQYKFLFTDLDGTLINTISGETFPKDATDFQLRKEVLDKIKSMPGLLGIFIVTNQGGIPEYVSEQDFKAKLHAVVMFVAGYCGHPAFCRYCASTDKADPMRKPNTGMLEDMMVEVLRPTPSVITEIPVESIYLFKQFSLMIGDASGKPGQFSDSDKRTAENFGIDYMDVEDFLTANI